MAFEKLKQFMNDDEDNKNVEEYYEGTKNIDLNVNAKMILLEPRAYSEAQQIVDYLKSRNSVVVKLQRVTPDQAKRIIDYLGGAIYAIKGDIQKLGNGIFLCTPSNVGVEGKISENTKSKTKKEVDEIDW